MSAEHDPVVIDRHLRELRSQLSPAPITAFTESVLRERATLALLDPDGEADAVAPVSPVRSWTILLGLAHCPSEPSITITPARGAAPDPTRLLERLGANLAREHGMVRCPAHEDRSASLSWRLTGDKALVKCFAGCTFGEILRAVTP